jgi:membrane-bound ClpP family serine protease
MRMIQAAIFSFVESIGTLQAILFIVGLLLMVAEIFTPGFGIAGGSGLVLLVVAIFLTASSPAEAMIMLLILALLVGIVLAVLLRSAKRGRLSRKLILWSATKREDGYSATPDVSDLVGREGTAVTILRPAGTGDFSGKRLDVVTEGSFIPAGSRIVITRTEGRRIVVESARPADPSAEPN